MKDEEKVNKCMDFTMVLWNTFTTIENQHPLDLSETCRDIHDIQNRLYSIAHKLGFKIKGKQI